MRTSRYALNDPVSPMSEMGKYFTSISEIYAANNARLQQTRAEIIQPDNPRARPLIPEKIRQDSIDFLGKLACPVMIGISVYVLYSGIKSLYKKSVAKRERHRAEKRRDGFRYILTQDEMEENTIVLGKKAY